MGPAFSKSGTSSSSNRSLGILPTNIWQRGAWKHLNFNWREELQLDFSWISFHQLLAVNYQSNKSYYSGKSVITRRSKTWTPARNRKAARLYLCTDGWLSPWMNSFRWGTAILPLARCHIKCVASPLQQSLWLDTIQPKKWPHFYQTASSL